MDPTCERLTVERWLKSKMPLLDEDGIKSVLAEWGISPEMEPSELTERQRDLILAQGYFEQYMLCGSIPDTKDSDGNWSHSEGAINVSESDKNRWKNLYIRLRKKWGEESLLKPAIQLQTRGIRVWHARK